MEFDVLHGGKSVLTTLRPIVYAECGSLDTAWPCVLYMRELGYEAFIFCFDAYNPGNFRGSLVDFFGKGRESGLLFVPNESTKKPVEGMRPYSVILPVDTLDDLALGLLTVPGYKWGVLSRTRAARILDVRNVLNS